MSTQTSINAFFQPTQISGCQLWLDAADTSKLTLSGSNVTQWNDKSGNGRNATATTPPTYNAARRSVVFNGSTQFMSLPDGTLGTGSSNYSAFFVASTNTPNSPQWVLVQGNTVTSQFLGFFFWATQALFHSWWINEYGFNNVTATATNIIAGYTYDGTTRLTYANGTSSAANTPGIAKNTTSNDALIGKRLAGEFLNGTISEIIFYTSILTTAQRQNVEGYLAWKWGLQGSLPATHPYKNSIIPPLLNPPTTLPVVLQNTAPTNITGNSRSIVISSSWQPSDISGLLVWTDASKLNLQNNTALTTWSNAGSQGTVNCTGTFLRNQLNGLGIVRMATTNTWTISTPPNPSAYSLFFTTRQRGGTNRRVLQGVAGSNYLYGYWQGRKNVFNANGNPSFLGGSPSDSAWDIFSHTRAQNSSYIFNWNGSNSYRGTTSVNLPMGGLVINTGGFPGEASDCDLAEIILYDSVLNTSQVQQMEGYLAWKWGLVSSLPANHPFKKWPPPPPP
jgi:hypothetical protein